MGKKRKKEGAHAMTKKADKTQHTELTEVTPEMALDWVTQNTHNRPVRQHAVESYCADMLADNWRLTHQGIAFDWNGVLGDGQHRLLAIIKSKKTVLMNVTYNMDPAALANIDGQIVRTTGDQLNLIDGRPNGRRIASCAMVVRDIESGFDVRRTKMTLDQAREVYARHTAGIEWALSVFGARKNFGKAPVAGAMAYAYPRDPVKANKFAEQIVNGEQLTRKDPAYSLRNFLLTGPSERMLTSVITLRSFYAFCLHHELEVIKPALMTADAPVFQKTLAYFRRGHA